MNKTVKTITAILALLFLSHTVFAAGKKSIVCTTFPEYDWIVNILGPSSSVFTVTRLQNNGTDLHSYQPSVKDIAKVSKADLFVYVGGESDKWIDKVVKEAVNKNQITVNMMTALGDKVREEELVEGMQGEEEQEDEGEEETEYDEHVWLSIENAIALSNILCEKLCVIDRANEYLYKNNLALYTKKLSALNSEYIEVCKASKKDTVLFGDRYPFRYLTDDYGIKYYAAFVGCSAESEASFETIAFLAGKVDSLDLNTVLTIEKSNKKIAQTIVKNTKKKDVQILEMDSLQSVTEKEIKEGRTYYSAMKKNLEVLKKALN